MRHLIERFWQREGIVVNPIGDIRPNVLDLDTIVTRRQVLSGLLVIATGLPAIISACSEQQIPLQSPQVVATAAKRNENNPVTSNLDKEVTKEIQSEIELATCVVFVTFLDKKTGEKKPFQGTAWYVGENQFVTNAHVLNNVGEFTTEDIIEISLSKKGHFSPIFTKDLFKVAIPDNDDGKINYPLGMNDIGVFILDPKRQDPSSKKEYFTHKFSYIENYIIELGKKIIISGYPHEFVKGTAGLNSTLYIITPTIDGIYPENMIITVASEDGGASGSPVFIIKDGKVYVIGMVSGGDVNNYVRITSLNGVNNLRKEAKF